MDASNTEFFPYQFKPVLNFLDSPSQGILIADEVGLGKTIEAGLIWTELRARFDANRLLVLCPAVLQEKWQEELAHRFGVKADICNAKELASLLRRQLNGSINGFAAIASIQGARPPKDWQNKPNSTRGSAELARLFAQVDTGEPLFDCVVIDEAHYLRNPHTQTHELATLVRDVAENMVLLSATPIQLRNEDLYHLLNIIDAENFQYVSAFRDVLEANQPIVQLASDLRRKRLSQNELIAGLENALCHPLLQNNRQLLHFKENPPSGEDLNDPGIRESYATRIERVNLLARVVNRTRKRDVQENRVIRNPVAPQVEMTAKETEFYERVTDLVRHYCLDKELHERFILTIPQRQMCSSMPAAFRAWKKKLGAEVDEAFLYESGVDDEGGKTESVGPLVAAIASAVESIANYDELARDDSKYSALLDTLQEYWKRYPDGKVILFSYYRETLKYLHERLQTEGIASMLLMGGMKESKHGQIDQFRQSRNLRILLASEVASEGVDLQFASFLVNYDLPWNPMRVEQRIGRIDRIGQKADRIQIVNFFYADTLDDRIYNRLFQRLDIFKHALGDIEAVLGDKIRELSLELLAHELTPEQEEERIEQTRLAVARTKREQEELEEEAAHLAAHGDYVLNKVKAAKQMRRYIDGSDLWRYVKDALSQEFPGTELVRLEDDPLTTEIGLTQEAKVEFKHFLDTTKMFGATRLARAYGGERVKCVFSNKVDFSTHRHEVVNQSHPLIRFLIGRVQGKSHHPLVATEVSRIDLPTSQPGYYMVTTQMWRTSGARTVEKLVFKGMDITQRKPISDNAAESMLNTAIATGKDWPAAKGILDLKIVTEQYEDLLTTLEDQFDEYAEMMEMENNDRVDFLIKSLTKKIDSQVAGIENIISKLHMSGKTKLIPANEGKIRKLREHLDTRKSLFEKQRKISTDKVDITTVVIHVKG